MAHAFWKGLAFAALIIADGALAASASADVCTDLQARLDGLTRTNGASSDAYRAYDAQVAQQRSALDRATGDARAAGCYGGFFAPKPSPKCPQLMSSISTMSASLAQVISVRDQYKSDPYALTGQRNEVLRLMSLNRCSNYAAYVPPPQGGGFFASLFGGGLFGNGYYSGSPYGYGATYRTVCVRSCDGYYFPISFSTTADHFTSDQASCQAMCPGASVSLYTHHNPGEEVDSMVSLAGQPYSALPAAFKYRTAYDSSCTCGSPTAAPPVDQATADPSGVTPDGRATVTAINFPGANATFVPLVPPATPLVPRPSLRPAASEDPETLADRSGRLIPTPVPDPNTTPSAVTVDGRSIRIVGPSYFVAR